MRRALLVLLAALSLSSSGSAISAEKAAGLGLADSSDCAGPLTCDASLTCPSAPIVADHAAVAPVPAAAGAALLQRFECGRCHDVAKVGLEATPKARNCAGCHAWIARSRYDAVELEEGRERYARWDEYVENVESFLSVPDLGAAARLDPEWIASYLRAPYKVRPAIGESMPRLPVSEGDAEEIAKWITARRPALTGVALDASRIATRPESGAGERLYAEMGCANCHTFGGRAAKPGMPGAPDLAHARRRMRRADIAAYIADPRAFGGNPSMPSHGLTAGEAAILRDFVVGAPVEGPEPSRISAEIAPRPLLTRRVEWREVNERIFGAVCVHCHMNPEAEDGEGGPGNSGGLGYEGVGLDLSSWEGLVAGKILDGKLQERLRLRHEERAREEAGPHAPPAHAPGMPLGLAPLSAEDLQLLESWIAQGAPGPAGTRALPRNRISAENQGGRK